MGARKGTESSVMVIQKVLSGMGRLIVDERVVLRRGRELVWRVWRAVVVVRRSAGRLNRRDDLRVWWSSICARILG